MSDYRLLPIHPDFSGPGGEPHQIQVNGLIRKVSLFHGRGDEEFDWHIYLRLSSAVARTIGQFLRQRDPSITDNNVGDLYCELMVIDDWHRRSVTWPPWQGTFQRKYDTGDLTRPLRLIKAGSDHAAHDLARPIADEPGENKDLSESSRLFLDRGHIYVQGLLVLDVGDSKNRVEIHPPDSIAYAIGDGSKTLSVTQGDDDWPSHTVRWRVAWFANSAHHRINGEFPLKQRRTTTWYLALPGPVRAASTLPDLPNQPVGINVDITTQPINLWDSKNKKWYDSRGVSTVEDAKVEIDPRDNRRKLRVSATMDVPGGRGGLLSAIMWFGFVRM